MLQLLSVSDYWYGNIDGRNHTERSDFEIDDSSTSMAMAIFGDLCPPIGQRHVATHVFVSERRVESRACDFLYYC